MKSSQNNTTPLYSIEFCAGAGGQAIGLHRAGFKHVALVEIDPDASDTLRTNGQSHCWWHGSAVYNESLHDWTVPSDLPNISLVAGGVPCPPFSIAGKQLGANDDRDLFPRFLDLVEEIRPRAFMIENVRGLLGSKFDDYRRQILLRIQRMGYEAEWEVLEAHEFGVPQLRPRSILVAAEPDVWKFFKWPTSTMDAPTVGQTLLPLMASNGWESAEEWADRADTIAPTLVGGSRKHGGADLGPTRARQQWREQLGVCGVSLANAAPEPGFSGLPKLTVEMTAAIQAFPNTWEIQGKKTSRYRQIGNAFPPPVAEAVGRQIAEAIRLAD